MTGESGALLSVLERSRALGFLGPGPVLEHVDHARRLAAMAGAAPQRFLDLGTGGGIPGLVLAYEWPAAICTLLDSHQRRCAFLVEVLDRLGLSARVEVACGRAESLARAPELRQAFDLVVARSFGPPAATAECAAGFLSQGGRLLVAEPPDASERAARWPADGLARLGLGAAERRSDGQVTVAVMEMGTLDDRWPRRTGVPHKRPLWQEHSRST